MPVTLTCEHCGVIFARSPSRARGARFCSPECNYAFRREHRDWPVPEDRVTLTCEACGDDFDVRPSEAHRRVCSWDCETLRRSEAPTEEHPCFTGRVARSCKWCGNSFEVYPSALRKGRGVFCSRSCSGAWICRNAQNRVSEAEKAFAEFLREHGFDFDVQVKVRSYVIDVVFPRERVAVEFDGDYWHDLPRTAAKDERKDAALRRAGYEVVRIRQTHHDADPAASIERIAAALTPEEA